MERKRALDSLVMDVKLFAPLQQAGGQGRTDDGLASTARESRAPGSLLLKRVDGFGGSLTSGYARLSHVISAHRVKELALEELTWPSTCLGWTKPGCCAVNRGTAD